MGPLQTNLYFIRHELIKKITPLWVSAYSSRSCFIMPIPKATRGLEPISYSGALLSTLLHATVCVYYTICWMYWYWLQIKWDYKKKCQLLIRNCEIKALKLCNFGNHNNKLPRDITRSSGKNQSLTFLSVETNRIEKEVTRNPALLHVYLLPWKRCYRASALQWWGNTHVHTEW
jgi:hypothetical protein